MPAASSWLARHARLFAAHARVHLRRQALYGTSLAFEQLSYLVQLVVGILLWKHLFTRLPRFEGWTFDSILVLHLFGSLFLALFHSFFMGCHTFHTLILNGGLDMLLVRPVDARLASMAAAMQPTECINRLLSLVPLLLFMHWRGVHVEPWRAAAALGAMAIGLVTFSLIQLTVGYSAFWFGRGDAILSFLDLFYGYYRFPLNSLPFAAKMALTVFVPVLLAVTYPALFATGGAGGVELGWTIGAALLLAAVWMAVQKRVYKLGLAAYQGAGG